jgi:hypothetical protein
MNTSLATHYFVCLALTLAACARSSAQSQGANDPSSGAAAQTYTIRLHRPARVGLRTRETHIANNREIRVVHANGSVASREEQQTRVEFAALAEVLAVNSVFKPTRVRYTVERFETSDGTQSTRVLAAGTVIEVNRSASREQSTVTIAGTSASEAIREALGEAINLSVNDVSEDAVFGTRAPRALGTSWDVNFEALRTEMEQGPLEIPPDRIQGTVTLADVVNRDHNDPLLDVRSRVNINGARLRSVPEVFSSMALTIQMHVRLLISARDLDAPPAQIERTIDMRGHGAGTMQGTPIEIDTETHSERRETYVVVQ